MAGRVVPMRFGDVDILVQAVTVPGTEPTSSAGAVTGELVDALRHARTAVHAVASSTADVLRDLAASHVTRPDKVEVEFGIGFSVKGNVIVVSGEAEATLKITLTYNRAAAEHGVERAREDR
jgi:hypothetical protein